MSIPFLARWSTLVFAVLNVCLALTVSRVSAQTVGYGPTDFIIADQADGYDHSRISVYDQNLTFKGYLDTFFPSVNGLAFRFNGDLVASGANNQLRQYTPSGALVSSITDPHVGYGVDIKVGSDTHLYLSPQQPQQARGIAEFSVLGSFNRRFGSTFYGGVAVLPKAVLWAGGFKTTNPYNETGVGTVDVYDLNSGALIRTIELDNGEGAGESWSGPPVSMFYSAATDTVLLTDKSTGNVYERKTDGTFVRSFATGLRNPDLEGVTRGPGGDVFVTDSPLSLVFRWHSDGTFVSKTDISANTWHPMNIAWFGNLTQSTANPIDDPQAFVAQQYQDFLARQPDEQGLDFWTAKITQCGTDSTCIHNQRVAVAAQFFIAQEFEETGDVIYRLYRAAYGVMPAATSRVNVTYEQFTQDRSQLVGGPQLQQSTLDFANTFVGRAEFKAAYPDSLSASDYVNKVFDTANLTPFTNERNQEIAALSAASETRAQVLMDVSNLQVFKDRENNPAFVLMQYFGYLKRDPDQAGYDFWLGVLNNRDVNNYRGMVCSFITSAEYQQRFGYAITHTNQDCGQ